MVAGFSIIFACLFIGEALTRLFQLPVPGNVLGMLVLMASLMLGIVRLEQVKPVADGLLKHLGLFFVPPGVGLLLYGDVLKDSWLPIGLGLTLSTLVVLSVVGLVQQHLERKA